MTALVLALVMALGMLTGCASVEWDELKSKDVIATVNGLEITKQHVSYEYAQQSVSNQISAELMSQLGGGDAEEVAMEDAMCHTLGKYILGEIAREKGFGISKEDAYERAYNDLILSSKRSGMDYLSDYNEQIKAELYFDDEMMVDYASQDVYNTMAINEYVKSVMGELQYDYPDETDPREEQLRAAVTKVVKEEVKNVEVKLMHHGKSTLEKIDYAKLVSNAALTFVRAEDVVE